MTRPDGSLEGEERSIGDLLRAQNGMLARAHPIWFWIRACVQWCGVWALINTLSAAMPWHDADLHPQPRLDLALVVICGVVMGTIEWAQARNRAPGDDAAADSRAV